MSEQQDEQGQQQEQTYTPPEKGIALDPIGPEEPKEQPAAAPLPPQT